MKIRWPLSALLASACLATWPQARGADAAPTVEGTPAPPAAGTEATADAKSSNVKPEDRAAFLHPGEVLIFRLSWGIFSNAGELRIETAEETTPEGGRRIRVGIHTKSKGLISAVYPVNSNADSFIDPATGRPLLIERSGKEGDKDTHTTTVFNYETHRVTHTDFNRPKRSGEGDLPEEPAYDTFVAMMLARTWNLQPGEKRKVFGSFEDDIYELEATALKASRTKTPAGKFDVVEIELKQLGELKGFFKKGGTMRFFISTSEDPQIVRIELHASAGTFVMQLVSVEKAEPVKKPAP